ncbi:substrate-binding domain-containing protein [Cellulomonas bogoriensis]|nr:substrate-binding domain-containing protein [Cellulomonas bogoriensis]
MVGGFYFGGVIAGVTRAAGSAGHRVVAVQTHPTRLPRERHRGEPLPGVPCSLSAVDGLVVITQALPHHRIAQLRQLDIPVVVAGETSTEWNGSVVLSDNHGGARAAVEHLMGHGHVRIGFVGDLSQQDIRERYEGYRAAMADNGIQPDPGWLLEVTGTHGQSGADAAARFVAGGMPTTATIAATDQNAIGFIRALRAADFALPRDHAVIGFDHTDGGARMIPRLSSVNPRHDQVGEIAVEEVLAMFRGDRPEGDVIRVPTTLVTRESCGCSSTSTLGGVDAAVAEVTTPGRARLYELAQTAFTGAMGALNTRFTEDETRNGWVRAVLEPLDTAAERASGPSPVALHRLNDLTAALRPHPEALEQCLAAVREIEHELGSTVAQDLRRRAVLHRVTTDVVLALSKGCTRPAMARIGHLERTIADQYEVDMDLMSAKGESPRRLTWLPRAVRSPACLGLWTGPESACKERELEIVGVRGRSGTLARLLGQTITGGEFPPAALTRSESPDGASLTFVIPVTSGRSDWGLLAINGRVDAHTSYSREKYQHWAGLLAVALDQEQLVADLRQRELDLRRTASWENALADEIRMQAERHALWMQALDHGMWDWDVSAGTVYYTPQWKQSLGYAEDEIGSSPSEWLDRVHPEDRSSISALVASQLGGSPTPLRVEHRVRTASGGYRWMLCQAITVLDDAGCPARLIGALVDVTDQKQRELALSSRSLRDEDTGVPNRTLFLDRLGSAVERAATSERYDAALVLLSLERGPDRPLTPADTPARRLREAIDSLQGAAEEGDEIGRLGENVLAVLLHGTGRRGDPARVGAVVEVARSLPGLTAAVGAVESLQPYEDAGDALRAAEVVLQRDQADLERRREPRPSPSMPLGPAGVRRTGT